MHRTIIFLAALLTFAIQLQPGYAQELTQAGTPTPVLVTPQATVQSTVTVAVQAAGTPTSAPTPTPASASPPTVSTAAVDRISAGTADITFAQLNVPDIELLAPIDQYSLTYPVPYRWQINSEVSYLELNYNMAYFSSDIPLTAQNQLVNDVVNVYYNEVLVATFVPKPGENNVVQIPLPAESLEGQPENHRVSFLYISGDCDFTGEQPFLVINNSSSIHFDYNLPPLEIDLAQFPRPLIQDLFEPESILLVIPDSYSDADLTAAASVAAAIGAYTFNNANVSLITAGQATPARLSNTSVVIIGSPSSNSLLSDLYLNDNSLPTTLNEDATAILASQDQPITPNDGVIQEILSPYSPDHVFLIVTGNNDQAITGAARALSALSPRYGFVGNLAVVEEFQNLVPAGSDQVDTFSLSDYGFKDITFYGMDNFSESFRFFVPYDWEILDDPHLKLSYIHAASINSVGSNITVSLNGKPVGNVPIETDEVLGERTALISLSKNDLKTGAFNRLTFDVTLDVELPDCHLPDPDTIWLRIDDGSELYLPHTKKTETSVTPSLQDAFSRLITRQDMSNIMFAMPRLPTQTELQGLVDAAMWLGYFSGGPSFAPVVSREDSVESLAQADIPYHVIALGRPTANYFISQINQQLPQPFVPGEDNLQQTVGNVIYRLPAQFKIGLLQALNAPWDPASSILVATGTSDDSVAQALAALTDPDIYYQLNHNLAFISGDNIEYVDSTLFVREALVSGVEAVSPGQGEIAMEEITSTVSIVTPAPDSPAVPIHGEVRTYAPPEKTGPSSLLVLGLINIGILIVIVGAYVTWRKARKKGDSTK